MQDAWRRYKNFSVVSAWNRAHTRAGASSIFHRSKTKRPAAFFRSSTHTRRPLARRQHFSLNSQREKQLWKQIAGALVNHGACHLYICASSARVELLKEQPMHWRLAKCQALSIIYSDFLYRKVIRFPSQVQLGWMCAAFLLSRVDVRMQKCCATCDNWRDLQNIYTRVLAKLEFRTS